MVADWVKREEGMIYETGSVHLSEHDTENPTSTLSYSVWFCIPVKSVICSLTWCALTLVQSRRMTIWTGLYQVGLDGGKGRWPSQRMTGRNGRAATITNFVTAGHSTKPRCSYFFSFIDMVVMFSFLRGKSWILSLLKALQWFSFTKKELTKAT